jgi:hypothetical protein
MINMDLMNGFVALLTTFVYLVNILDMRIIPITFTIVVQEPMETQWPLYATFYYLQLLELYFENLAERQLLFDFVSINLLSLHDKETKPFDPPILSSSSSSDDDD